MKHPSFTAATLFASLFLASCQGGQEERVATYEGIGPQETVKFTGTEPFWGGEVTGETLIYETPSDIPGAGIDEVEIPVERFAGNSGLGFAGELDGKSFDMVVTEGECSDGMSDRTYPFTVTLEIGDETRHGCAWSDARPFSGPENP